VPVVAQARPLDAPMATAAPLRAHAVRKSQARRIREWAERAYRKRNAQVNCPGSHC